MVKMIFDQTVTLFREHPRSIIIISTIQFGLHFVSKGMLLFFPDILNQTAEFLTDGSQSVSLCEIVEGAIESRKTKWEEGERVCDEVLDLSAYFYSIILEICYFVGYLVITLLVNSIGHLKIFSFLYFSTATCGFLIALVQHPTISTYLYVWLLVCGLSNNLLFTVTYELFPTNLRSLALGLSLMLGRLGALVGGNIVGFLLESNCTSTFVLSGAALLTCGVLTFFIPNIFRNK